MTNYNVSRRFTRLTDSLLNQFAGVIVSSMTGNLAFPAPLVPVGEVATLQSDFATAMQDSTNGGMRDTAIKNAARRALLTALRMEADYVQGVARHDVAMLLSSGFLPASLNRAQTMLSTPLILAVLNEGTGQLTLRLTPIANARGYDLRMQAGDGDWQDMGVFSQARRLMLTGLVPGTVYNIQVRAIGGTMRYSDWSKATQKMSL